MLFQVYKALQHVDQPTVETGFGELVRLQNITLPLPCCPELFRGLNLYPYWWGTDLPLEAAVDDL